MPHWTLTTADNVVYATIKEAMSGSETDVEMYLHSLKQELHIGQDGYPSHVTLAGDQQTFAMKLQKKIPRSPRLGFNYSWRLAPYETYIQSAKRPMGWGD